VLEGITVAYRHRDDDRPDRGGRWVAEETGEAAYRTRILVLAPTEPARFNGTVVLHWQNVSAGFEIGRPEEDELYRGYAWVGVSAQEISLYGSPWGASIRGRSSAPQGLIDTDPERYSTLSHPGDAGSFEIFGQAAGAIGPERVGEIDPLGGLDVRRVVATGGSQSAMRLAAYVNGIHAGHQLIDGFLLSAWEGRAPRLEQGPLGTNVSTAIRPDLGVPLLVVNSEFEAMTGAGADMADHDLLRMWEVAGTAHGTLRRAVPPAESGWRPNPLSWAPVHQAALRAMHTWLTTGVAAPAPPRILTTAGPDSKLARDEHGNVVGGVRLPDICVPVGTYRGTSFRTGFGALFGGYRPFSPDVIKALYPNRATFLARWDEAIDDLLAARLLLAPDAPALRARGRDVASSNDLADRAELA
jgi:hypothetical protein